MAAKPIKSFKLHNTMIQFLINAFILRLENNFSHGFGLTPNDFSLPELKNQLSMSPTPHDISFRNWESCDELLKIYAFPNFERTIFCHELHIISVFFNFLRTFVMMNVS